MKKVRDFSKEITDIFKNGNFTTEKLVKVKNSPEGLSRKMEMT